VTNSAISVEAFNHWRYDRTAAMTLVDLCHGGALYYYRSPYSCTVWVFAGADALLISYSFEGRGPEGVRSEVKRLLDALYGSSDYAALGKGLYPNLAALHRGEDESLWVPCFNPGDWCGLLRAELPPLWDQLPPGWLEPERARIAELAEARVRIAAASNSRDAIHPVSRALVALSKFAEAETVVRRILALAERTSDADAIAGATQSLGVVHAYQGRFDDAAPLLDRAIQLWSAARGTDDPRVASARDTLERVLARQGK
jgi:hypothetical protein